MEIRTAYGPKAPIRLKCGKSMTKQTHARECDINYIMAKFLKTGLIEHRNTHAENYGFATSDDYHTSLNVIQLAQDMFSELPSQARTKFENDPAKFLDYVQNPENADSLYDLGLTDLPPYPKEKTVETPPDVDE